MSDPKKNILAKIDALKKRAQPYQLPELYDMIKKYGQGQGWTMVKTVAHVFSYFIEREISSKRIKT